MSLNAILSRITDGEIIPSAEFLPYLCLERRAQRAEVSHLLARAYWKSGREDFRQQARVFVRRAWILSGFSPKVLPLYLEIHAALNDIRAIREAHKRAGMMMAAQGNVAEAIKCFDLWQYAYFNLRHLDKYEYDFDILESMDRLARPYRLAPSPRSGRFNDGKIRIAYLIKGITELGSVLIKTSLVFARFHDRARVEPLFFVPESERAVLASEAGREHVRLFESHGCKVVMAPNESATKERLAAIARLIQNAEPDVFVAGAALADFEHYFITSMRPAPVVIGFVLGPPEQFAPPALDWGIAWSKHPLIDCPVNCSLMDMEMELPERGRIVPYQRRELDIPEQAVIVGTAGRHVKFQDSDFWKAVIQLLDMHPQMCYLAMGVEETQIPFLSAMLTPEVRTRVRFLSWRGADYLRALSVVDILLDTFPSGGGTVLIDAMALGIPVVAFQNNYMRQYDQTDWSPAEEFNLPEIIVPRADFPQMKRAVSRLIEDHEHRFVMGQLCERHLWHTRSNPERAVRRCEEIYFRVLRYASSENLVQDAREAEVEELARRHARPQSVPRWISRAAWQLKRALRFGERVLDRVA